MSGSDQPFLRYSFSERCETHQVSQILLDKNVNRVWKYSQWYIIVPRHMYFYFCDSETYTLGKTEMYRIDNINIPPVGIPRAFEQLMCPWGWTLTSGGWYWGGESNTTWGGGREGFKLRGNVEVTTMKTSRDNAIHWSAVRLKVVLWSKRMLKGDFFLYHYQENI